MVSPEQLSTATAQNLASDSFAWLLGPLLGGLFYGLGRAVPFLLDAISYVCSVLGLFFMHTKFQEERTRAPRQIWKEISEGVVWLWHTPVLRFLAILSWGLGTPVYGYALILITLAQGLHATPFVIGAIFASAGIGSIAGSFLAPLLQQRLTFGWLIIWSAWIWAISWLLFALAPNPLILGIAVALSFIIVPVFNATLLSYRLIITPDDLRGRVGSVFRLISFGGQPLGVLITGLLIQWTGPIWAVVILFVPQGIAALAATLYRPLRETPFLREVAREIWQVGSIPVTKVAHPPTCSSGQLSCSLTGFQRGVGGYPRGMRLMAKDCIATVNLELFFSRLVVGWSLTTVQDAILVLNMFYAYLPHPLRGGLC